MPALYVTCAVHWCFDRDREAIMCSAVLFLAVLFLAYDAESIICIHAANE